MRTLILVICTSVAALAALIAPPAAALQVDNFVLLDHKGDAHELFYHKAAKAIVIVAQSNDCPADPQTLKSLSAMNADAGDTRVFMLNANLIEDRAAISAHMQQQDSTLPVLQDETQLIADSLDLRHNGETLVIDPNTWQVVYRGPAGSATSAINELRAGQQPEPVEIAVSNCPIKFPQQNKSVASYSRDIAPLLQEKCVVCHTEGGLGPWAMSGYNMILGFAPMIREVVRTRRMPPWHADPHVGVWKNDISLSIQQTQALINWIEAGAPRGDGPDPLAQVTVAAAEWPLGQPDLVLDIPPHTVPASGVVDYQFPIVKNPLDKGVWIKAATVVPGDREVVHHILAGTIDADTTQLRRDSGVFDNYLIGYAPGNESHTFPADTGVFIPPGGEFMFQLHYTPIGRETVDRSRIGLYFHTETPANFYRQDVVVNPLLKIPPQTPRHKEVAYYEFSKPAMLHDLIPHAHYRGVASRFELYKPDGSRELILNVPNYDFNWQRTYEFVEPKRIEPGTRLVHTTWYDNSAANPGNPDPEREVPWGLQSWDEMLYGGFSYTYVDETTESPIHDRQLARTTQYVGFLDQNLDGKLSWRELPKRLKKRLVQGFKAVDTNGDGGLDIQEMLKLSDAAERDDEAQDKAPAETSANADAR